MTIQLRLPSVDGHVGAQSAGEAKRVDVERLLQNSSHFELRRVDCSFAEGTATLSGRVSSFYLKQVAQTIVQQSAHVEQVDNQLHVASSR